MFDQIMHLNTYVPLLNNCDSLLLLWVGAAERGERLITRVRSLLPRSLITTSAMLEEVREDMEMF